MCGTGFQVKQQLQPADNKKIIYLGRLISDFLVQVPKYIKIHYVQQKNFETWDVVPSPQQDAAGTPHTSSTHPPLLSPHQRQHPELITCETKTHQSNKFPKRCKTIHRKLLGSKTYFEKNEKIGKLLTLLFGSNVFCAPTSSSSIMVS